MLHSKSIPGPSKSKHMQNHDLFESKNLIHSEAAWKIDQDEYETIIKKLKTQNTSQRLEAMKQFVDLQVMDVKINCWEQLSEQFQQCLLCTNDELFSLALKAHYKIICIESFCAEGYISLLKGLVAIVWHKHFTNQIKLDLRNRTQNNVLQILGFLLKMQKIFLKSCVRLKFQNLKHFMDNFAKLLASPKVNVFADILCVLDKNAQWICNFCYKYQIRELLFKRIAPFVHFQVNRFLVYLEELTNGNKSCFSYDIGFIQFSHCTHFLAEILKYNATSNFFPVKFYNTYISINSLLLKALSKLRDSHKFNANATDLLVFFVKELASNNQTHFDNNIITVLIDSLRETTNFKKIKNRKYIFDIISHHCNTDKSIDLFFLSPKNNNLAQSIIDLTIHQIRNFVNVIEYEHQLPEIIIDLLTTCENLFRAFSRSFLICNPKKLIVATRDLFVATSNYNVNSFYKLELSRLLCSFIINYNETYKILYDSSAISSEVIRLKMSNDSITNENLIVLLNASQFESNKILKNFHDFVLKFFLLKIQILYETDLQFLEECNFNKLRVNNLDFTNVIFALSHSTELVKSFLSFQCEIITENDNYPTTIFELTKFALSEETGFLPQSIIGLVIIKLLTSNISLLIHLQSALNLKVTVK